MGTAATSTLAPVDTQRRVGGDEPFEGSVEWITYDGQRVGDEESSSADAVYDEIAFSSESTHPASQPYNELIRSDAAPVATHGTGVDVYSPLQARDANNMVTKITIAIGKCDVNIVFNGDADSVTVPSDIQRTHAASPTS